uniref:hypothetical protein n=1 Tax=Haslea pseudostrearia TaxID=197756 RepID=UPI00220B58CE|nr:hypothetical protein ON958_mgp16 [Haslea pseudostrearia]UXN44207.1 hypothetical protein [Haslea pseudostrearia]
MKTKKTFYLQNKLEKTHFNLVKKTLYFIKNNYKKPIHKKDDPTEIFVSLIEAYYLDKTAKNIDILQKILKRIQTRNYIEHSTLNSELLNLLIIPWKTKTGYFTILHLETLESSIQELLMEYFKFVEKELTTYILTSVQILNLTKLLKKNDGKTMIKQIQLLKYNDDLSLWLLRKSLNSAIDHENNNISLESKHLFLTTQLLLVKNTLEAETYQEIFFFRNLLTDFLFLSKLVT